MPTLKINLAENLTASTQAMVADLRGPGTITAASRSLANDLRDWFGELEQTRPNKMGWPRQHFYSDVRGSVQKPVVVDPGFAEVSITHRAIRQRVEGGKIVPEKGEFLTIPARPEAYGHVAREFHNLHFGFAENRYGNLAPALIENLSQDVKFGRQRKDGSRKVTPGAERGGEVFFWLVRQVYQAADPGVLPPEARVAAAVERGALEYATALADRENERGNS